MGEGEAEMEELQATLDHRSLLGMLKHVWYRGESGPPLLARHTPLKKVRPAPLRRCATAKAHHSALFILLSRVHEASLPCRPKNTFKKSTTVLGAYPWHRETIWV